MRLKNNFIPIKCEDCKGTCLVLAAKICPGDVPEVHCPYCASLVDITNFPLDRLDDSEKLETSVFAAELRTLITTLIDECLNEKSWRNRAKLQRPDGEHKQKRRTERKPKVAKAVPRKRASRSKRIRAKK